jgi:hypothetical protein
MSRSRLVRVEWRASRVSNGVWAVAGKLAGPLGGPGGSGRPPGLSVECGGRCRGFGGVQPQTEIGERGGRMVEFVGVLGGESGGGPGERGRCRFVEAGGDFR